MKRNRCPVIDSLGFGLLFVLGVIAEAQGQNRGTADLTMGSLERYLTKDRNAEIALAQSAAPAATSNDATILVLGGRGYETAVEGKNGFVCLVERAWMNPYHHREFWNPKIRGPICFNPAAARSVLPFTLKRTELALAGLTPDQMRDSIKVALAQKEVPALEPGAMSFMMAKEGFIDVAAGHWVPHLMFYVPQTDSAAWGADVPHSPVLLSPQFQGAPEPITVFMIPVSKWSDGTAAPPM